MKNKSIILFLILGTTFSMANACCEKYIKNVFTIENAKNEALKNNASPQCLEKIEKSKSCKPVCDTFGNGSLKKCAETNLRKVSEACKAAAGL